jgi:hypothetical protein
MRGSFDTRRPLAIVFCLCYYTLTVKNCLFDRKKGKDHEKSIIFASHAPYAAEPLRLR